jgi:hypothetical protein
MAKQPEIKYLTGGEQTTVNSTITELFPCLAFNSGARPKSWQEMESFIKGVSLKGTKTKKTFVNDSNTKAAETFIKKLDLIRPKMKEEKLKNACAITDYLYDLNKKRAISYVVWGYREKPKGVPGGHAGDIFVFFADKASPAILGVSLKAGSESSKEPKLNSYVKTTLMKPIWKKAAPNALDELKNELWVNVYSKIPKLPKMVNKDNYYTTVGTKEALRVHPALIEALIEFFESNPKKFDELYGVMNRLCRQKMASVINKNFDTTKKWIREEFRLESGDSKKVECPLVLVKAIGQKYDINEDKLASFIRLATSAKAYLKEDSVQEWFIDLTNNKKEKITLLMTIRSDSEFRRSKPKGKLGTFVGLKLLYRGVKK